MRGFNATTVGKDRHLRISQPQDRLIKRAAEELGITPNDLIRSASIEAAAEVLLQKKELDDEQWTELRNAAKGAASVQPATND